MSSAPQTPSWQKTAHDMPGSEFGVCQSPGQLVHGDGQPRGQTPALPPALGSPRHHAPALLHMPARCVATEDGKTSLPLSIVMARKQWNIHLFLSPLVINLEVGSDLNSL